MTKNEIDQALDKWYNALETGINQSMPKISQEIIQKPITSPLLNYTKHQFRQLYQMFLVQGWTQQNYYRYRMFRIMIKNESQRIKRDNWAKLLEKTAMNYKEPQEFWRMIKKLKGNKTIASQHLQINNTKLINDKDKEAAHRSIWQEVFKISSQENAEYDREIEAEVERYLENNQDKITTFQTSDLNRLRSYNHIDTLISQVEIKAIIKSFKTNTPGDTNINKIILNNIPERALTILQAI